MPGLVNLKDIWLLPNLLSLSRIALLPAFIYLLTKPENNTICFVIFLLMVLSDFLDGYLSRKLHQVSELGKLLDPFADKIAILGSAIALYLYKDFPLWYILALFVRDFSLIIGGIWLYKSRQVVVMANIWGKLTTISLAFLAGFHLLEIKEAIIPSLIVSVGLFTVSTVVYVATFFQKIKSAHSV